MSTYSIKIGDYQVKTTVISSIPQLHQSLKQMLSIMSENTDLKRVVGLDIEKDYSPSNGVDNKVTERVVLVRLCFGTTVLIIQLVPMNAPPCSLSKFLQLQELCFVSIGMKHCLEALEKDYGIKCRNAVDLGQLAATVRKNESLKVFGLLDLAYEVGSFSTDTKKELSSICYAPALSSWGGSVLPKEQVAAAACRGFLCFYIGNYLLGGYLRIESSRPSYYDWD